MAKFELKPQSRDNYDNVVQIRKVLKLLSKLLYSGCTLTVEFGGREGKARFIKRWFAAGYWHSVNL